MYMHTKDVANSTVKYEDIFDTDVAKQKQATALYMKCFEIRETILNSKPAASKLVPCIDLARVC